MSIISHCGQMRERPGSFKNIQENLYSIYSADFLLLYTGSESREVGFLNKVQLFPFYSEPTSSIKHPILLGSLTQLTDPRDQETK